MAPPRAAIIGVAGPRLMPEEAALFRNSPPLGVILFARNIESPAQLRALTDDIRGLLGAAAPILIDQEGGRVARLKPPHWEAFPAAARFEGRAEIAQRANARLLGAMCRAAGLDVVCAPVLDLRLPGAHQVIGDRAFSAAPEEVVRLGAACIAGLQAAGCIPVMKHIPGHGRSLSDSHHELPRVGASAADLAADIAPFRAVAGSGAWAMTAHVLYEAWDAHLPATLSPTVIQRVIRGEIGFDGLLITDDLAMGALAGRTNDLASAAFLAGCDIVLHCTGKFEDGAALLATCPLITEGTMRRLAFADVARRGFGAGDQAALRILRDGRLGRDQAGASGCHDGALAAGSEAWSAFRSGNPVGVDLTATHDPDPTER
ncbi:MAG: beta-N-acetylhexosaminidase [Roseomonas sp.]|nr:beta-N-acetylhexosaminidase [Roseomonas sp.]MCA3328242.1 beta-N-acetylhexosaminidase [Roseomonas sp.]MCA3329885.1 beta-N-acetylhexosaminidase [Roseomonas sp.]MCA3333548.1 beta-N-acetylhexosaminidase [Roseomonas sp.]MCA3353685.1 beta-N-acetylhexosaminidase [Roseomonas sp.]